MQEGRYHRVQVHFHPDDYKELDKLREAGQFRRIPDMIRTAIALLKVYIDATKGGYRLQMAKGEEVKEIILARL